MSININSVLNSFTKDLQAHKNNASRTTSSSGNYDASIFQKASAIVAQYKDKQAEEEKNGSKGSLIGGLSFSQIANMDTKAFLDYAMDNKATSGFSEKTEEITTTNALGEQETTNVKLPMLVSYKGTVISTAGKSFMAVVAKIKAKHPRRSEEEIAAELLSKYCNNSTSKTSSQNSANKPVTGSSINFSA